MTNYTTQMMKTVMGALTIVSVLGASDALAQQRPQSYTAAEAQLRADVKQINVVVAQETTRRRGQLLGIDSNIDAPLNRCVSGIVDELGSIEPDCLNIWSASRCVVTYAGTVYCH